MRRGMEPIYGNTGECCYIFLCQFLSITVKSPMHCQCQYYFRILCFVLTIKLFQFNSIAISDRISFNCRRSYDFIQLPFPIGWMDIASIFANTFMRFQSKWSEKTGQEEHKLVGEFMPVIIKGRQLVQHPSTFHP